MMIVQTNKQKQYLIKLCKITLLNCLNANGIIRFKYNQKLKQKRKGKHDRRTSKTRV